MALPQAVPLDARYEDEVPHRGDTSLSRGLVLNGHFMSIITTRAPLRISLGGGGTDIPSYYRQRGGFLVAGAIDKYVYFMAHTVFQRRYRMKYSEFEEADRIEDIRHPILRETLLRHWQGDPLEIASLADVPAGTGLGSSGAYTVGAIKAVSPPQLIGPAPRGLGEEAAPIEVGGVRVAGGEPRKK